MPNSSPFWKDKVVFLTGASSGIGEALAIEIAKRGAVLGLLARRFLGQCQVLTLLDSQMGLRTLK